MKPKISVIVPVYNTEKYLEACVGSIVRQTWSDLEIILVDDGSKDACSALCDALASSDSRIRVIHQENAGLGMARNKGIDVAVGEYVGFVDSDDVIEEDFIEKLVMCAADEMVDAVIGGMTDVYPGELKKSKHFLSGQVLEKQQILEELLPAMLGYDKFCSGYAGMSVCKGIYRKEILDRYHVRFYSERKIISEDAVFDIDFYSRCRKVAVSDSTGYHYFHRNSQNSLTTSYSLERFAKYKHLYKFELDRLEQHGILTDTLKNRVQSMFVANCRVTIMQESNCGNSIQVKLQNIRKWLKDHTLCSVLEAYDYSSYPKKLKLFTYFMESENALAACLLAFLQTRYGKSRG